MPQNPNMPGPFDTTEVPQTSPMKRTIGVEIECLTPSAHYWEDLITNADLNPNVSAHSDGSIDGDGYGIELVTSPLTGDEAEDTITSLCNLISEKRGKTNSTTGLHVHVDAKELAGKNIVREIRWETPSDERINLKANESIVYINRNVLANTANTPISQDGSQGSIASRVIQLVETVGQANATGRHGMGSILAPYNEISSMGGNRSTSIVIDHTKYEMYRTFVVDFSACISIRTRLFHAMRFFSAVDSVFRSLVPSSRRHNTYCQPYEKIVRNGGVCPATYSELLEGISQRYCGINLQALSKHGTIENRYHGGTTNATKIIHWARLWEACVRFVCTQGHNVSPEADTLSEVVNGKNRLEMLCALLDIPDDTQKYLLTRYTANLGSDAKHAISYINRKLAAQGRAPRN